MNSLIDPLSSSAHLTKGFSNEDQIRRTFAGMAHFAGTGPAGKTCRECVFWNWSREGYYGQKKFGGTLKPQRCLRYSQLSNGRQGETIPSNAQACKYFEPAPTERPLTRPAR
jgi:hypothetical protein